MDHTCRSHEYEVRCISMHLMNGAIPALTAPMVEDKVGMKICQTKALDHETSTRPSPVLLPIIIPRVVMACL